MRKCSKCGLYKPLTNNEFWPWTSRREFDYPCKECKNKRNNERRHSYKLSVLTHYSKGSLMCSCKGCNEHRYEFLTLHHTNNDGAAHRKKIGTNAIWSWVVIRNYPEGFAILCYNCNCSLQFNGYCPHEREKQQ